MTGSSRTKGSIGLNAVSYWPLYARDISKEKKYDISGQKYADSQDYNSLITLGLGKVPIIPVIKVWLEQHSSSVFVVDYQSFYACSVRYNASHLFVKFLWSLVYTLSSDCSPCRQKVCLNLRQKHVKKVSKQNPTLLIQRILANEYSRHNSGLKNARVRRNPSFIQTIFNFPTCFDWDNSHSQREDVEWKIYITV